MAPVPPLHVAKQGTPAPAKSTLRLIIHDKIRMAGIRQAPDPMTNNVAKQGLPGGTDELLCSKLTFNRTPIKYVRLFC